MDYLNHKIANIEKMIHLLDEAIEKLGRCDEDDIPSFQDSVVARFKILIESIWKLLKLHLEIGGFADVPASPKGVIKYAVESHVITADEYEFLMRCITLRNYASHIYDQPQYLLVVDAAPEGLRCIRQLLPRLSKNL